MDIISTSSFDEYNNQLQELALKATKHAALLPPDLAFHRSMGKDIAHDIDSCSSRVLTMANQLLDLISATEGSKSSKGKERVRLENEDDIVDDFQSMVAGAVDRILENADMRMDEYLGLSKPPAINVKAPKPVPVKPKPSGSQQRGRLDPALQHAARLPKPQLRFKRPVDNHDTSIWQPRLSHKYNAKVPLGFQSRTEDILEPQTITRIHPYRYEIKTIDYPARMFHSAEPRLPNSFENTPFVWVDTPSEFSTMLEKLRGAEEIAIDLEHHSYRTFSGFVCLMQISTRESDWVVDTIALREELEELNEVFTDPNIVKVFHGAESDIIWLQQDFNLYIVNLFDTFHASKVLEFPRHNLATLLEMYCDFIPDKRYQLADWRIRPLPEEMLHYARSDTHFLLYIYDNLRNALLDLSQSRSQSRAHSPMLHSPSAGVSARDLSDSTNFLREVLSRSEETALRVYEREIYDSDSGTGPGGWDTLARKWNKATFSAAQGSGPKLDVYKAIHSWRDRIAREQDESTRYVLANHFVFSLAENPPTSLTALLAVFPSVPPVLRKRAGTLFAVIQDAMKRHQTDASQVTESTHETNETQAPQPSLQITEGSMSKESTAAYNNLFPTALPSLLRLPLTSVSSFFAPAEGRQDSVTHQQPKYLSTGSNLFKNRPPSEVSSLKSKNQTQRFEEIVSMIHSQLAVAPSIPHVEKDRPQQTETTEVTVHQLPSVEKAEVPYIPASMRQKVVIIKEEDSIVVVGHVKQNKRKRISKTNVLPKAAEHTSEPEKEQEPFDFTSVPNMLDDGSDREATQSVVKKKSKRQGQANFYGDFPAPPKALSQPKQGNQSRTFKR